VINKRRILLLAVVGLCGLVGGGVVAVAVLGTGNSVGSGRHGLHVVTELAETAIVISDARLVEIARMRGHGFAYFDVDVESLLFDGPVAAKRRPDQNVGSWPGSSLQVYEALGDGDRPALGIEEGPAVLLLEYHDPSVYTDYETPWSVVAGFDTTTGRFRGDYWSIELLNAQLDEFPLTRADPLSTLLAWMAEKDAMRGGARPGEIEQAFQGFLAGTQVAPEKAWVDTDVRLRSLDPESAPPEVLSELTPTTVFIDMPNLDEDLVIELRTPIGVAHRAAVSVGSHAATVFTRPGDSWDVVLARSGELEGTLIGSVTSNLRDSVPLQGAVLLPVTDEQLTAAASKDGPVDRFRPSVLTRGEFALRMAQLAEPGFPLPEP
jgi:hypothetical protein